MKMKFKFPKLKIRKRKKLRAAALRRPLRAGGLRGQICQRDRHAYADEERKEQRPTGAVAIPHGRGFIPENALGLADVVYAQRRHADENNGENDRELEERLLQPASRPER